MEKNKFFNLSGSAVEIESWKLRQKDVQKAAEKFFKRKVDCRPCFLHGYDNHCTHELGWICDSAEKIDMFGFFGVESGFSMYADNKVRAGLPITYTGNTFLGCTVFFDNGEIKLKNTKKS